MLCSAPMATVEFELQNVAVVEAAADELTVEGYELIHGTKEEAWGQTVARLLSPEGCSSAPVPRRGCTQSSYCIMPRRSRGTCRRPG